MGYFTHIADQAFKKGESGETLFFLGGPWSRPIVLEDEERQKRTYRKHLWMIRVLLTPLILGGPFLVTAIPEITEKVVGFAGFLLLSFLIAWIAQRIVFRPELHECSRLAHRLSFRSFHQQMADSHSREGLLVGLIGCILGVAVGIWSAFSFSSDQRALLGLIIFAFSGACGVGWGYALKLKGHSSTNSKQEG